MRLNKFLALCGVASRRKCDKLIAENQIFVNGVVAGIGTIVNPDKDIVLFQDTLVTLDKKKYFLFYKPLGVLTTIIDPYDRPCLGDFIKDMDVRLFSVGRLDSDSEGLLLLTNDGDFSHKLQHPKYKISKIYVVETDKKLTAQQENQFKEGIPLEEGITAPANIEVQGKNNYKITLRQGWNRQIRRMLGYLGVQVVSLKRIQIGKYSLDFMEPGEIKEIHDIKKLKKN